MLPFWGHSVECCSSIEMININTHESDTNINNSEHKIDIFEFVKNGILGLSSF